MTMNKPTAEDLERGYSECKCGHGIHLLNAGFECDLSMCMQCCELVADKTEFFKFQTGTEILSK